MSTQQVDIRQLSTLELHIGSALAYLDAGNEDAARGHLDKAIRAAAEASELISRIGTTGVERTDIIRRAEEWNNNYL